MTFLHDLRRAFSGLRRTPGFTAVALLTLTLGIGASTAVFSVLQTLFLKPLPFTESGRLVHLHTADLNRHFPGSRYLALSAPAYRDLQERQQVFSGVAALQSKTLTLTGLGDAERLKGLRVTGSFFPVLGVRPALGRTLLPADEQGPGTVVLSHRLWMQRCGGDPGVLGRSLTLNGQGLVVVGVLPAAFPWPGEPDVFVADPPRPEELRGARGTLAFKGIARLKAGVTLDQARRSMEKLGEELQREFPGARDWGIGTTGLWEFMYGDRRAASGLLLLTGLFVLAIACANLANLLSSRAVSRQRDLALRQALGAGWLEGLRPFLADGLVLSGAGAALGLGLAWGLGGLLRPYVPPELVPAYGLDLRVLTFTLGMALLTALIAGVVPAVLCARQSLSRTLREQDRGASGRSGLLGNTLVAAQVALTLALLVSFGTLWQSLRRLQQAPMGFQADQALAFTVLPSERKYPEEAQQIALFRRILRDLSGLPGVQVAASTSATPLGGDIGGDFEVPGRSLGNLSAHYRGISPGGFRALGMTLLQGRDFQDGDCQERPEHVIVSRSLAARCWPGEDALGKAILKRMFDEKGTLFRVVGVVDDVRHEGPGVARDLETIYWPAYGVSWGSTARIVVRAEQPAALVPAIRAAMKGIDPELPLTGIQTLGAVLDESLEASRSQASLMGLLAGVALCLAAAGIYGAMSQAVSQRTREIGIRKALGGQNGQVAWTIARRGLGLTAIGLGAGALLTRVLGRALASQLYGVSPADPLSLTFAGLAFGVVALAASMIPAARVARVDPARVLRSE